MRFLLIGAAVAALTISYGSAQASTVCSSSCDHEYSTCNTLNGGSAQQLCMPKWMQCKKACTAPVKAPTRVSNISTAPKR